jgi:putative transposase
MQIIPNQLYHIYNQGNNQETIFYDRNDYLLFLQKVRKLIMPFADIVCYSLMPNHYHFLINTNEKSAETVMLGHLPSTQLANGFRLLNSGYANEFNKKNDRSGSLFRQKTQAKNMGFYDFIGNYPFTCFHYIHQNAMVAGLCPKMENWEFCSFQDYIGMRNGTLINKQIAFDLIGVSKDRFYEESYQVIDPSKIRRLFE